MSPMLIEFRVRRSDEVLTKMPLFDFLKVLHCQSVAADEFAFDELRILIDGKELFPSECGHA
jgi:hypothetical protein